MSARDRVVPDRRYRRYRRNRAESPKSEGWGETYVNSEKHHELRTRTKAFALRVIRMSQALPRTREANVLIQQILRSATSMAANYRAAGRSRSKAEFIAKIGIVVEEADETVFWLEMLGDSGIVQSAKLQNWSMKRRNWSQSLRRQEKLQKRKSLTSNPITAIPRDYARFRRYFPRFYPFPKGFSKSGL